MPLPDFSDEPSSRPSRSRSTYRSGKRSPLLPLVLGVGLLGAIVVIVVLVLNRDQQPEKKNDPKAETTVLAPNKGERKQATPPRSQDEPKADRPKIDKAESVKSGPSVTVNDSKTRRTTLEKCMGDEFALADLNKAGVKSTFSAANAEVTLKNDTATIVKFEMCVVDTKYDFDREVLTLTAVPSLLVTQRDAKRLVGYSTYYLQFNCLAKEDDARRYKEMFNAGLLDIDVEYKIRKFTPHREEGSVGYPNAEAVTSYLIETEVLTARLKSR